MKAGYKKESYWKRLGFGGDLGQATAEYALVMLGAAAVAGLFVAWAAGTDGISRLLDAVMDSIIPAS